MWTFRVSLTLIPEDVPRTPRRDTAQESPEWWKIRGRALEHLYQISGASPESDPLGQEIRKAIGEVVADRLSSPDFRFFVTEFEEHPGSWEIAFVVVGALYGGVCGYGAFRSGLDYIYSDLKQLFGSINGLRARVGKRFKDRHIMGKVRNEPTLDLDKPAGERSPPPNSAA